MHHPPPPHATSVIIKQFFSLHQVCLRIPILNTCFHFHHIYTLVRRINKPSNNKMIKQQTEHIKRTILLIKKKLTSIY